MLKDFGAINADTLRVYPRRKHIRDAFDSTVATKAEYDALRNSASQAKVCSLVLKDIGYVALIII